MITIAVRAGLLAAVCASPVIAQTVDDLRARERERFCELSAHEVRLAMGGLNTFMQVRGQIYARMISLTAATAEARRELEEQRRQWESLNASVETSLRILANWVTVRSHLECSPR